MPPSSPAAELTLDQLSGAAVYDHLRHLRATEPVAWVPVLDAWLVTRRDLAVEVIRDPDTYTVDHPGFSTAMVFGSSMLSLDHGDHARHRLPFEPAFRRPAVRDGLGPIVDAVVEATIDELGFAGDVAPPEARIDLRTHFAAPIAARTMAALLGLPPESVGDMLGWYATFLDGITAVTAGQPIGPEVRRSFDRLRDHVLDALDGGGEALLSTLGGASELSEAELVANVGVLLFGGIETTEGTIASALFHVLSNPPVLEALLAEENTAARDRPASLLDAVVEESLRIEPAAAVVDRYATRDTVLDGVAIEAGQLVSVSLTAANRDPALFDEPDRFDPWRPNLGRHLTFAQGPHVCLGLHLARLETRTALAGLLRRCPDLRLDAEHQAAPRGLVFRKPSVLMASRLE